MAFLLNGQQQDSLIQLDKFINSKTDKLFLLEGFAGTGKTTVITHLFGSRKFKKDIAFAATTNKAVSVIQSMFKHKYEHVDFKTIHKLCKIKRKITNDGDISYNLNECPEHFKKNQRTIFHYDIIIIDECSMISANILTLIVGYSKRIKGKIIFVGDRYQLPPVNEDMSDVFKLPLSKSILSTVVRCNDSIIKFASRIRNSIDTGANISTKGCKSDYFKTFKKSNLWLEDFLTNFDTAKNNILLAYTNSRCNEINKYIRNAIYGALATQEYIQNEVIVFNTYYSEKSISLYPINESENTFIVSPPEDSAAIEDDSENKGIFYTSHKGIVKNCKEINLLLPSFPLESLFNLSKKLDFKFKPHAPETYDPDHDCPICFDKIKDKKSIETDCGHIFCQTCIKTWMEQNNQCPYCRMVITPSETLVVKDDAMLGELITNFKKLTNNVSYRVWHMYIESPTMSGVVYTPIKQERERFEKSVQEIKDAIHKIKDHIVKTAKDNKYTAKQEFVVTRLWEYFYYSYIDIFADISYGYCITIHKSQGSTFHDVYIDSNNIMSFKNKDTLNCLYTAVTRSSNAVNMLI